MLFKGGPADGNDLDVLGNEVVLSYWSHSEKRIVSLLYRMMRKPSGDMIFPEYFFGFIEEIDAKYTEEKFTELTGKPNANS